MSNIRIKVDCIHNDQGPWCLNRKVKRDLFGFGPRCCPVPYGNGCDLKEEHERPSQPPPPPKPPLGRIIREHSNPTKRCNICGSSMAKWGRNGCIQPECVNYYTGKK